MHIVSQNIIAFEKEMEWSVALVKNRQLSVIYIMVQWAKNSKAEVNRSHGGDTTLQDKERYGWGRDGERN